VTSGSSSLGLGCGTVLGKYKLLKELGNGGMGTVFLAEDQELGRNIALKVLRPLLGADGEFVSRFKTEARSVAAITHPNVVRINSFECINGHHVIDMEYIEGCNLKEALGREVPVPALVLSLVSGVVQGLAACHANGIVHRDVKPQNILIAMSGRVVLTDFGIAAAYSEHMRAAMSRSSSTTCFIGTPRYAPPEAWERAEPSPAWDVYSLGLILYEALSGEEVYSGESPFEILRAMHEKPEVADPEKLSHLPQALSELIRAMCASKPERRPKDALEVLKSLQEIPEYKDAISNTDVTLSYPYPVFRRPNKIISTAKKYAWQSVAVLMLFGILVATVVDIRLNGGSALIQRLSSPFSSPFDSTAEQIAVWQAYSANTLRESTFNVTGLTWTINGDVGAAQKALVFDDSRLMYLKLNPVSGENFSVAGNGGGYTLPGGIGFREISITGNGRWTGNDSAFMTLDFKAGDTGEKWEWVGTLDASEVYSPGRDSLFALERADAPQAILSRELLPRQREWAKEVLAHLPAQEYAHLIVPLIKGEMPEVEGVRMMQSTWLSSRFAEAGRSIPLPTTPRRNFFVLDARAYDDGVCLLFYGIETPEDKIRLRISLCPLLGIPVKDSPVYTVNLQPGADGLGEMRRANRDLPWDCDWKMKTHTENKATSVEVFIPNASFPEAAHAKSGKYWRINAMMTAGKNGDPIQWGDADFQAAYLGCLLQFSTAVQSEQSVSPKLAEKG